MRWRGYTEEDDTFEPNANIPRQWRDEFEEEQRRGREAPATPKPPKPPKAPRVPRVVELTAHEPEELRPLCWRCAVRHGQAVLELEGRVCCRAA